MADYLDEYGIEETRRNRVVKRIVLSAIAIVVVAVAAYLFLRNYKEKQAVKNFLTEVNSGQLPAAYTTWGCTATHPCRDYSYQKFLEDWGHKKNWRITDVDGCPAGAVVTSRQTGRNHHRCGSAAAMKHSAFPLGLSAKVSNGGSSSFSNELPATSICSDLRALA